MKHLVSGVERKVNTKKKKGCVQVGGVGKDKRREERYLKKKEKNEESWERKKKNENSQENLIRV